MDYDYGMRIYDARIAKFLSVDPLTKEIPGQSPYVYSSDNPILFLENYGEGPKLPPLFDPTHFITNLGLAHPLIAFGFAKAYNTSLSHLQKAAWYSPKASLKDPRYHNVSTNFNTLYGVAGEIEMMQRFLTSIGPNQIMAFPVDFIKNWKTVAKSVEYVHQTVKFTLEPDKFTDFTITYTPKVGDKGGYIYAFDDIREPFIGSPYLLRQSIKYEATTKTEFVHEVKIVSPDNNDLLDIIENGVDQLLTNQRVIDGGVPVLVIDEKAAEQAMKKDYTRFVKAIRKLHEKNNGGLVTESGLNKNAVDSVNGAIQTIRNTTAAPPQGYYNGTSAQNKDDKENN